MNQEQQIQTESRYQKAQRAIDSIDHKTIDIGQNMLDHVFPAMYGSSESELFDLFRAIEKRFKLSKKERNVMEGSFRMFIDQEDQKRIEDISLSDFPEEVRRQALERLRSDGVFPYLASDLDKLGLVGEQNNAVLFFLVGQSARMLRPLHAAVFGVSAGGKTSLVKTVLGLFPRQSTLIIASATTRAFDYLDPKFTRHKVVFVEEFEGMGDSLDSLRLVMSESNASRLVAVQNPSTNQWTAQISNARHTFSLVTTTTRSFIPPETSNRMLCLYIDQTKAHLNEVGQRILERHTLASKAAEQERESIRRLYQVMHLLLELDVDVDIPFAKLIRFPFDQARHNRDLEKFLSLIEAIAFTRQHQKEIKTISRKKWVEADLTDYQIAYNLIPYALAEAVEELTKPEEDILRIAIVGVRAMMTEKKVSREDAFFTTRLILEQSRRSSIDVGDQTKIGQVLKSLEFKGFVEGTGDKKQGSRRKYILALELDVDRHDCILGIQPSLMSQVSSPEELENEIRQAASSIDEGEDVIEVNGVHLGKDE
jgi:hypothetical protein